MRHLIRSTTAVVTVVICTLALAVPAAANVRRAVPEQDPYAPIYARSLHVENPTSEWIPIIFYRSVSCVAGSYDLVAMFDLSAWSCPLTVRGHVVYHAPDDLENFRSPLQVRLQGDAVPVWFVLRSDWEASGGTADFTQPVTMEQIEEMPSLLKGTATSYREVLHPPATFAGGGATIVKDLYHARGELEDGRAFRVHVAGRHDPHGDPTSVDNYRLSTWNVTFREAK